MIRIVCSLVTADTDGKILYAYLELDLNKVKQLLGLIKSSADIPTLLGTKMVFVNARFLNQDPKFITSIGDIDDDEPLDTDLELDIESDDKWLRVSSSLNITDNDEVDIDGSTICIDEDGVFWEMTENHGCITYSTRILRKDILQGMLLELEPLTKKRKQKTK